MHELWTGWNAKTVACLIFSLLVFLIWRVEPELFGNLQVSNLSPMCLISRLVFSDLMGTFCIKCDFSTLIFFMTLLHSCIWIASCSSAAPGVIKHTAWASRLQCKQEVLAANIICYRFFICGVRPHASHWLLGIVAQPVCINHNTMVAKQHNHPKYLKMGVKAILVVQNSRVMSSPRGICQLFSDGCLSTFWCFYFLKL